MIELRNVGKRYGNLAVLDNVSLTIAQGEIVSLVGASGTGKTTLLKIVAGLIQPSAGSTTIGRGRPFQGHRSCDLGYVLQNPVLLPWRNVLENVTLPLELRKVTPLKRKAMAIEVLERVGLGEFVGALPHELSGGMKQRVAIARALVFAPAMLIMDEPFGALDEQMREQYDLDVRKLAKELQQTVLFVTHSLSEAVLLSDRVVVLGGRPAQVKGIVSIVMSEERLHEIGSMRQVELVQRLRTMIKRAG